MDVARRLDRPVLDDPNVLREDDPPRLRFEKVVLEDRHVTEDTGIFGYKDAIKVHVSAYGDNKNEVPFIAKTTEKLPETSQKIIKKLVPIERQTLDENGNVTGVETVHQEREVMEDVTTFEEVTVYPWIDQLEERLRHGRISEGYFNVCKAALEQWERNGDIPVDGTPVIEWAGVSLAQKQRLIDQGINTIERVSSMTEDALQAVGMGARDIKRRAEKYLLEQSKQNGEVSEMRKLVESQSSEMSDLQKKIKELEAKAAEKPKSKAKKEDS